MINMFIFSEIREATKPTEFKWHTEVVWFFFLIPSEEQTTLHPFLRKEFCIFLLEISRAFVHIGRRIYVCLRFRDKALSSLFAFFSCD